MPDKKFKTAQIGETVKYIKVELDALMSAKKSTVEGMKVIGLSKYFICLDGDLFPKLATSKTFDVGYSALDVVSICEKTSDFDIKYFGKFNINLYTTESSIVKIERRINKEFKAWVNEKLSAYGIARDFNIKLEAA